jgi:hypothetical protein
MLRITEKQFDRLTECCRDAAIDRLVHYVAGIQGIEPTEPGLRREVEDAVGRGQELGLRRESSLRSFLDLCIAEGWRCDSETHWIRKALAGARISDPERRLAWILDAREHRRALTLANQALREDFL